MNPFPPYLGAFKTQACCVGHASDRHEQHFSLQRHGLAFGCFATYTDSTLGLFELIEFRVNLGLTPRFRKLRSNSFEPHRPRAAPDVATIQRS